MAASLVHVVSSLLPNLSSPTAASRRLCPSFPVLRLASSSYPCRRLLSPLVPLSAKSPSARGHGLRLRRLVATFAASSEESRDSELDNDKVKEKAEIKYEEAQEAWREILKQFKEEALRMQVLAMQAYNAYSKKTVEVLMETSEKLRILADKAQKDLSVVAAEVGEEGQEYLKMAAQNSPNSVKDVTETFRSLGNLNGLSDYEDYHVGIPFGTFLTVAGFLNFMMTGSISGIRFGFMLGLALLTLSISSLRSQRIGHRSRLLLKGQAAISSVIFFRELSVFCQNGWFPRIFLVLLSGAAAAFYIYRIVIGIRKGPSTESGSEN